MFLYLPCNKYALFVNKHIKNIPLGITGRSGERDFIHINRLPQHPASNLSTIK